MTVTRARKIQRFLSQPFFVAEVFTGVPGIFVPIDETVESFEALVNGELDNVPEQAFLNVGGVESVLGPRRKSLEAGCQLVADGVFGVEVVTLPRRPCYIIMTSAVVLTTSGGDMTVLDGHISLIADVVPCLIKVAQPDGAGGAARRPRRFPAGRGPPRCGRRADGGRRAAARHVHPGHRAGRRGGGDGRGDRRAAGRAGEGRRRRHAGGRTSHGPAAAPRHPTTRTAATIRRWLCRRPRKALARAELRLAVAAEATLTARPESQPKESRRIRPAWPGTCWRRPCGSVPDLERIDERLGRGPELVVVHALQSSPSVIPVAAKKQLFPWTRSSVVSTASTRSRPRRRRRAPPRCAGRAALDLGAHALEGSGGQDAFGRPADAEEDVGAGTGHPVAIAPATSPSEMSRMRARWPAPRRQSVVAGPVQDHRRQVADGPPASAKTRGSRWACAGCAGPGPGPTASFSM